MAKQTGIHGLRGKVNGMSYYSSKNGGSLVRKINEGLGERVKSSREYSNTRKNNAEFGACGDFAGAFIKPISLRWRFILDSIATGMMVKALKELLQRDSTKPWGQRAFDSTMNPIVLQQFNAFSKNPMLEEIANVLNGGVTFQANAELVAVSAIPSLTVDRQHELMAEGINHVSVKVFAFEVEAPTYNQVNKSYTKAISSLKEVTDMSQDIAISGTAPVNLFTAASATADLEGVTADGLFGGLLVVVLPGRTIGSVTSILQEKCSAMIAEVTEAE